MTPDQEDDIRCSVEDEKSIDAILARALLEAWGVERAECLDLLAKSEAWGIQMDYLEAELATEREKAKDRENLLQAYETAVGDVNTARDLQAKVAALREVDVEWACEVMHDAYEAAAVGAGWETNPASRKSWAEVPESNKATMRVAVAALLVALDRLNEEPLTDADVEKVE